ncbi:MAG TPA: DUF4331 domain-containing protein [Acidimicrobiales bacterium]|nr:DUF4331 domain-containing protein [Acidimicrobiales bacterium]
MSSHREAPEISKDPVADSADLYAFVSPDSPDTVTLIANYVPSQGPAGGPNFYAFGDDVLYQIHIDNNGDGEAEITYQFRFQDEVKIPTTFLYNVGPIQSIDSPNWNRRQFYSVTRIQHDRGRSEELGSHLACPPCNIGPLSTPDYPTLAMQAVHELPHGHVVYAGQRADPFYVDLGSIFDLGDLRPLANLHATFGLPALLASNGVSTNKLLNVHAISIQIPKSELTVDRWNAEDRADQRAVIGVWTSASRQKVRILGDRQSGEEVNAGPFVQVSRMGNPLFNEVLIPLAKKDYWNTQRPADDKQFVSQVEHPELAALLPVLYPPLHWFSRLPQSGRPERLRKTKSGPGRHPAHGPAAQCHSRLPELHRVDPSRPASAQHGHQAVNQPEQPGPARGRPGRLPQRSPGLRRHRQHRAAGHRRGDVLVDRPHLQAGWRGPGHHPGAHGQRHRPHRQRHPGLSPCVPICGRASQRLQCARGLANRSRP